MMPKRRSGEETRREIITAALALLADIPPDRLSTTTIAERVGVSQAALFRHYRTKDALWVAVLNEVEARAHSAWDTAEAEPTALVRLEATLNAQLALIEATPALPTLIFSPGRQAADNATRPVHQRIITELRERLSRHVAVAVRDKELDPHAEPEDAALLLLGLLQGVVLRWSLSGRAFDLRAEGARLLALQLRLMGAAGVGR